MRDNIHRGMYSLQLASEKMKDYETVVLVAAGKNGRVLEFASENMKDNETVVLVAIRRDVCALQFASESMRNNIGRGMDSLQCASENMKDNETVVWVAVGRKGKGSRVCKWKHERQRDSCLGCRWQECKGSQVCK